MLKLVIKGTGEVAKYHLYVGKLKPFNSSAFVQVFEYAELTQRGMQPTQMWLYAVLQKTPKHVA